MQNRLPRKYIVGSEWLSYKIYCSENTADNLLISSIYPAIKKLLKDDSIEKFFFIRYNDPEFHIRLRVKLKETDKLGYVISVFYKLFNKYILNESISTIQIDTYLREIERYGEFTMELSESFFHCDSLHVLQILSSINLNADHDSRWLHAAFLINHYLDLFEFSLADKIEFLKTLKTGFQNEYEFSKQDNLNMANSYKQKRDSLFLLLNMSPKVPGRLNGLSRSHRTEQLNIADSLVSNLKYNVPFITKERLIASLFHMSLNRAFKSDNRISEMTLYDFMYRYFKEEFYKKK